MAPKSTEFQCFFYFLRRVSRQKPVAQIRFQPMPFTTSYASGAFPGQGCTISQPTEIQLAWPDETRYCSHHPNWRRYSGGPARGRRHAGGFLGIPGWPGRTSRDPTRVPRARAVAVLDIATQVGPVIAVCDHEYESGSIKLVAMEAQIVRGNITLSVHDKMRWLPASELPSLKLVPAAIPIVQSLLQT